MAYTKALRTEGASAWDAPTAELMDALTPLFEDGKHWPTLCALAMVSTAWRNAVSETRLTLKCIILDGAQLGEPRKRSSFSRVPTCCKVFRTTHPLSDGMGSERCPTCDGRLPSAVYFEDPPERFILKTHLQRWQRCLHAIALLCPRLESLVVRDCQHAPAKELVNALVLAACPRREVGVARPQLQRLRHVNLEGCTSPSNADVSSAFTVLPCLEQLELAHAVFECSR